VHELGGLSEHLGQEEGTPGPEGTPVNQDQPSDSDSDDEILRSQMPRGNRGWDEHNSAINADTPDRSTHAPTKKRPRSAYSVGKRLEFTSPEHDVVQVSSPPNITRVGSNIQVSSPPNITRVGSNIDEVIDASLAMGERLTRMMQSQELLAAQQDIQDLKKALAKSLDANAALAKMVTAHHQSVMRVEKELGNRVNNLETEMADMEGSLEGIERQLAKRKRTEERNECHAANEYKQ
jgi:hypothetical protein